MNVKRKCRTSRQRRQKALSNEEKNVLEVILRLKMGKTVGEEEGTGEKLTEKREIMEIKDCLLVKLNEFPMRMCEDVYQS